MSERKRINLRIQVEETTPAAEVCHYLIHNPIWDVKQGKAMLVQTLNDRWLAYARQASDPELAKSTAISCIERLEYQIELLRQDFGLKPTASELTGELDLAKLIAQLVGEVQLIPGAINELVKSLTGGGLVLQPPARAIVPAEQPPPDPNDFFEEVLNMLGPLNEDLSKDPNQEEGEQIG